MYLNKEPCLNCLGKNELERLGISGHPDQPADHHLLDYKVKGTVSELKPFPKSNSVNSVRCCLEILRGGGDRVFRS